MKSTLSSLILVLLVSACSRQTQSDKTEGAVVSKPRFAITAADLAAPPEIGTNGAGSGHETIVIRLQLSPAKTDAFRRFTHEHLNRQTQLVVGPKVVAEPFVAAKISDGRAELAFSSLEEAQAVRDLLRKK